MKVLKKIQETKEYIAGLKKENKTIGFVPTMGALHHGHISLAERAKRENDSSIYSIFVNPLQFNDKKDLEKYPRTFEEDIEKLTRAHCDAVFAPPVEEMYPENHTAGIGLDLGILTRVMEGACRPGHYEGVCTVVKKLFEIIEPDRAYFGEKDFQQLVIIQYMVKTLGIPVEIVACPTVRESSGLALSSRNMLLNDEEKRNAVHIYATLQEVKKKAKDINGAGELKKWAMNKISENPFLLPEYFEIVNAETLLPVQSLNETKPLRACIAVKVGTVRLIDNIEL